MQVVEVPLRLAQAATAGWRQLAAEADLRHQQATQLSLLSRLLGTCVSSRSKHAWLRPADTCHAACACSH